MTDEPRKPPTADDVRHWLGLLPELCALLPDAAVARGAIDGPRPAAASKPPVKLHVLHLLDTREKWDWEWGMWQVDPDRQGVLPYLWGWVRDLEATAYEDSADLPGETPETPTVSNCCDWLARHLHIAEHLAQWAEFAGGIKAVHRNVTAAVSSVQSVAEKRVPCGTCGFGHLERDGEANRWLCRACGHIVTVQAVTLPQAARIVGVKRQTLYDWANRPGILRPLSSVLGERGSTRKLYDLSDVRRLVAENRLRRVVE